MWAIRLSFTDISAVMMMRPTMVDFIAENKLRDGQHEAGMAILEPTGRHAATAP
jgi:hypothetical protein